MAKFHKDWIKIVDFLLMANFWKCAVFFVSDFSCSLAAFLEKILSIISNNHRQMLQYVQLFIVKLG